MEIHFNVERNLKEIGCKISGTIVRFCSYGASTFWYMNDLGTDFIWTSSDHGMTFESIRNPRRVDDTDGKSLLKFENGALWEPCRTGEGQDSIVVYRSTDSGTTWLLVSSFRVSPGGKMSFDMDGDNVGVIWSESSYQGNLKYRYVIFGNRAADDIGRSAGSHSNRKCLYPEGMCGLWPMLGRIQVQSGINQLTVDKRGFLISNLTGLMQDMTFEDSIL